MTGNVSMNSVTMSPLRLQAKMRHIKRAGIENTVKVLDTPKPRLSHPLPGSNYGARVNLYV